MKKYKNLITIVLLFGFYSCGVKQNSKSPSQDRIEKQETFSKNDLRELCLEGAYRNGKHCFMNGARSELKRICDIMTRGSGSCYGFSSADLTSTCKAALYGRDYCGGIRNIDLQKVCKAAAYGHDRYCY